MKKVIYFLSLFFCLGTLAHAAEPTLDLAPPTHNLPSESLVAGSNSNNNCTLRNTWKPYWVKSASLQPPTSTFVQSNVGIGFLYFSGLRGNLQAGDPGQAAVFLKNDTPIQGSLNYNKTPLYEFLFGYQANNWLSFALSYQAQTDVSIYSNWQQVQALGGLFNSTTKFTSQLNLYGLTAKVYFSLPYSLMFKMMAFNPYIAVGVGPAWQTWRDFSIAEFSGQGRNATNVYITSPGVQKISANCMFVSDFGIKAQWMVKKFSFTVVKGFKFNIWGQARSMGKQSQQQFVSQRYCLSNPIRIKTVYSFAPYLGLQWNY